MQSWQLCIMQTVLATCHLCPPIAEHIRLNDTAVNLIFFQNQQTGTVGIWIIRSVESYRNAIMICELHEITVHICTTVQTWWWSPILIHDFQTEYQNQLDVLYSKRLQNHSTYVFKLYVHVRYITCNVYEVLCIYKDYPSRVRSRCYI